MIVMKIRCFLRHLAWLPLLILSTAGSGEAASVKPIDSLLAGAAYEIGPGDDGVRAPLVFHEGLASADLDPSVTVLDAALGTRRSEVIAKSFHAALDPEGALVVKVNGGPLRQGTYDLKLQVRMKAGKAGFQPAQTLDLRITQPAAQLRNPDTLVIEQAVGIFDTLKKTAPLLLTETSGRSPLKEVKVQQIDNPPGVSGKDVNGREIPVLTFDPVAAIPEGGTSSVTYRFQPAGDPVLGTVQGHAQVSSSQLVAPVPLTFEIRTRRTASWILVLAGLGLFCGLLLRTMLPQLVNLDQARIQAIDTLASIDRELARRKDGTFRANVQALCERLAAKVNQTPRVSAEELTKEITSATDALNKEIADLTVRLAATGQETERLGRLVETPWFLSEDLETARAQARKDLGDARSALLESDDLAAEQALLAARKGLAALPERIRDWSLSLEDLLDTLESPALPVSATMQAGLKESVTRLRSLVNDIPDPGVTPVFETLSQALEAVHKVRVSARQLLLKIKPGIETTLAEVTAALRPISPPGADPLAGLRAQAEAWLNELAAAAAVPESATPAVWALFVGLDTGLRKLLLDRIPIGGDPKEVQAELDQRAYGDAAHRVVLLVQAMQTHPSEGVVLGELDIQRDVVAPAASWSGIGGLRVDLPSWSTPRLLIDLSPGGIAATRSRILAELQEVTMLRTVLTWIGLLWLTFVTVDAFWNAAKGYKKV